MQPALEWKPPRDPSCLHSKGAVWKGSLGRRFLASSYSVTASKAPQQRLAIAAVVSSDKVLIMKNNTSAKQPSDKLTGQLADKPTRGQSSLGLDNSRTCQLADSEFLKIMELLYFICTLNLTLTLSNIGSV